MCFGWATWGWATTIQTRMLLTMTLAPVPVLVRVPVPVDSASEEDQDCVSTAHFLLARIQEADHSEDITPTRPALVNKPSGDRGHMLQAMTSVADALSGVTTSAPLEQNTWVPSEVITARVMEDHHPTWREVTSAPRQASHTQTPCRAVRERLVAVTQPARQLTLNLLLLVVATPTAWSVLPRALGRLR
jgi:hypothetical protein